MTYESEHRRLRPVLEHARELDISSNPDLLAIFDVLLAGFNLWCTPFDHPDGWEGVGMDQGAYAKPCEFVGTALWGWEGETITHVRLTTDAYALSERAQSVRHRLAFHNRPADMAWCRQKIEWLFQRAGVVCPPIVASDD